MTRCTDEKGWCSDITPFVCLHTSLPLSFHHMNWQSLCNWIRSNKFQHSITVSEPVFLKGFSVEEKRDASPSVMRGFLALDVFSPISIVKLTVTLKGTAQVGSEPSVDVVCLETSWDFDAASFHKGYFTFPFFFVLEPHLPESVCTNMAKFSYTLETELFHCHQDTLLKNVARHPLDVKRSLLDYKDSNSAVATGVWRSLMDYSIDVESKCLAIQELIRVNITLSPLILFSYKVCNVRLVLTQTIDNRRGDLRANRVVLYSRKVSDRDGGFYQDSFSTKLASCYNNANSDVSIYQSAAHEYSKNSQLHIEHSLKVVITMQHNQLEFSEKGKCTDFSVRSKRVELSLNTPVVVLRDRFCMGQASPSYCEKPPSWFVEGPPPY